jgi:hypothetical protein
MHKFNIFFLAVFGLWLNSIHASTVIVFRTDHEVLLGADSLMVEGGRRTFFCKIEQMQDTFVAMAGMSRAATNDPTVQFDAMRIAREVVRAGSIAAQGRRFKERAEKPFKRSVQVLYWYKRRVYDTQVANSDAFNIVFVGLDDGGQPAFSAVAFSVDTGPNGPIVTAREDSCPGNACSPDGNTAKLYGVNKDAIAAYRRPGFATGDFVTDIRKMIRVQITATPDLVNGPINILRVSPLYTDWVQNEEHCPVVSRRKK